MKLTSNKDQFAFKKINKINIRFTDGYEVVLNCIKEHYFDFDKTDSSYIEVMNTLVDKELFNRFCIDDDIIYLHIDGECIDETNTDTITLDIPCNMRITKLRMNGDIENATEMSIQLEGKVE